MRKKGFTLVELLAVIVILVIIGLITIPMLISVTDKAKVGSAQNSVIGYVRSIENQVAINSINKEHEFDLSSEKNYTMEELIDMGVRIKGKIDGGVVTLATNGTVSIAKICINNLSIKYENSKAQRITDDDYCSAKVALTGTPISNTTQILLDNNTTYGNYTYMGGTYLKGIQENNYVWYNGFLWRIIGKNSDGTIRLITEENVTAIPWGPYNDGNYVTTGYINDWLNNYFYGHLNDTKNIIQEGDYFCSEIASDVTLRTTCSKDSTIKAKVGLISSDEYNLSGASGQNNKYYLINGQEYWTMTPCDSSAAWYASYYYYEMNCNSSWMIYGARPVINIKSDSIITNGNGSVTKPYILEQFSNEVINKPLKNNSTSGEYINLSGKVYRIVAKEEQGIKLILDGYYETLENYNISRTNISLFPDSPMDILLNGTNNDGVILNWLNSDKIISATWNQGNNFDLGSPYTTSLTNNNDNIIRKVGLIRIGEMLSGQSSSIIEKQTYWTMTQYKYDWAIISIYDIGKAYFENVVNTFGVRPVIYVSNNTIINSGNGTQNNPYQI